MTQDRLLQLEQENHRLRKINEVLMDRVERSMDMQGDSFSIFQTAVLLENKVRDRTRALDMAQRVLHDAIAYLDEGFALYDHNDRLILSNEKFRRMWDLSDDFDGTFEQLVRMTVATRRLIVPQDNVEDWIIQRLARHRAPTVPLILSDRNGTWIQVSEKRTQDDRTVCLYTDISTFMAEENRKRQQDLMQMVERLTTANTELERFAYIASHDLREPLRTIVSFTQLLQRNLSDRPDLADYMALIIGAGQRMHDLIGGLLDYSRLSDISDLRRPCNLSRTLAVTQENLRSSIEQSGAIIDIDCLPVVQADPVQMIQLMQNLIGNAIKYRHPDRPPQVQVRATQRDDDWMISVTDNGIGIEDTQQDIYELFRRLHTSTAYPGAGIGLAVCRRIIQHHGGTLWHQSNPTGGTTFCFTLPRTGP